MQNSIPHAHVLTVTEGDGEEGEKWRSFKHIFCPTRECIKNKKSPGDEVALKMLLILLMMSSLYPCFAVVIDVHWCNI